MPAFTPILATLQARTGDRTKLQTGAMEHMYQLIQHDHPPDLVITANQTLMQKEIDAHRVDPNSVRVIAQTVPVLWCPSGDVVFRVSWRDTLKQSSLRSLASPTPLTNPLGALLSNIQPLPTHIRLVPAIQGMDAWRMARRGQADCALTVRGLVTEADHFQVISEGRINIYAAIPTRSSQPQQARRWLNLISGPIIQAQLRRQGY